MSWSQRKELLNEEILLLCDKFNEIWSLRRKTSGDGKRRGSDLKCNQSCNLDMYRKVTERLRDRVFNIEAVFSMFPGDAR